jgi:hypothetical protein
VPTRFIVSRERPIKQGIRVVSISISAASSVCGKFKINKSYKMTSINHLLLFLSQFHSYIFPSRILAPINSYSFLDSYESNRLCDV